MASLAILCELIMPIHENEKYYILVLWQSDEQEERGITRDGMQKRRGELVSRAREGKH